MRGNNMKTFNGFIVLVVVFFLACSQDSPSGLDSQDPGFNVEDLSSTNLVGNASLVGNVLRVTSSAPIQFGAAWLTTKLQVQTGFTAIFQFQIDSLGGITDPLGTTGADGFAFVIQNQSDSELGGPGGRIGYGGIPNSLAVEFDTWLNAEFSDPSNNHISVHTLGTKPNDVRQESSIGSVNPSITMSDGSVHTVGIEYVPGTMRIFLDDLTKPVLMVSVQLADILDLDDGKAFLGFSAATASAFENHDILSLKVKAGD